jgi:hypothetical protein
MSWRRAAVSIVTALAMTAIGAATEQQRDAPRVMATGQATIAGVVVADDEQRAPLRRVMLTLSRAGLDDTRVTATDDRGRYLFDRLPAGVYTLNGAKGGYVTASYGATKPGLPGSPIPLAEGQQFDAGRLALVRGAAIAGRLLNAKQRPVSYGMVEAIPVQSIAGERRRRFVASAPGSVATNAHGDFRIFGLAPGEYVIAAQTILTFTGQEERQPTAEELNWAQQQLRGGATPMVAPGANAASPPRPGRPVAYASTFFPGTNDAAAAAIVTLARGEERANLDFQMQYVPTTRVAGLVIGPDGMPAPRAFITRLPKRSSRVLNVTGISGSSASAADGSFEMIGIPPGDHVITARAAPGTAASQAPTDRGTPPAPMTLWGLAELTATGEDLSGLTIRLQPGMSVSGRIAFDGGAPESPADPRGVRLVLVPTSETGMATMTLPPAAVKPDGGFTFPGVLPGTYRLRVNPPPAGGPRGPWTPRSALLQSRNLLDVPVEVQPGVDVRDITVTLTDQQTRLSGTLVDRTGRPTPQFFVLAFAVDRNYWTTESRWVKSARAGADGTFALDGLPPGEYFLAALTELDPAQQQDSGFLDLVSPAAIKITLKEGQRLVQTLRVGG